MWEITKKTNTNKHISKHFFNVHNEVKLSNTAAKLQISVHN